MSLYETTPASGDYFIRVVGTEEEGSKSRGAVPYAWRMLPVGAKRGATQRQGVLERLRRVLGADPKQIATVHTNEFPISGLNLEKIDRMVLGDSLAEGKLLPRSRES